MSYEFIVKISKRFWRYSAHNSLRVGLFHTNSCISCRNIRRIVFAAKREIKINQMFVRQRVVREILNSNLRYTAKDIDSFIVGTFFCQRRPLYTAYFLCFLFFSVEFPFNLKSVVFSIVWVRLRNANKCSLHQWTRHIVQRLLCVRLRKEGSNIAL